MSLINRYLNFESNDNILLRLGVKLSLETDFTKYNECFINFANNSDNPDKTNNFIREQIQNYVNKNYSQINILDADINYYIERINIFVSKKFKDIIKEINISHLISLCDYFRQSSSSETNYYIFWRNEYYKIIYNCILTGMYKVNGMVEKKTLLVLIEECWNKINFDNLVEFTNSLNKINFLGQNIDEYNNLISNLFDDVENIVKLINYVNKKLKIETEKLDNSSDDFVEELSELEDYGKENKKNTSKYNFRTIINILKSNGYLLFEELNKNIKNKYKKAQTIQTIKTDKRIIGYFIYLISQKDTNTTNRKVNEILIRMKNYLEDIEESYYNNIAYRKITVRQESDKYKDVDLSTFNRENTTFTIYKYSNLEQNNINTFTLNKQIEPYFDIYKSYYNARYPDRDIEFNPVMSTMIVKMIFCSKVYYVNLALIQYIVLDKLFNADENIGLGIKEISTLTSIPIKNLQETINSLLQIKLIKRSMNAASILDMKLFINNDFTHNSNKISISHLVLPKEKMAEEDKKEFMHDRNTIILSNMYDYVKKHNTFAIDNIYEDLSKNKIPFEIDLEQVMVGIKIMLEKEDIVEILEESIKKYKYNI